jgi:ADP-heptose:LPS heptosyltransferase
MRTLGRHISLFMRKFDSARERGRWLRSFAEWKALQHGLPPARQCRKTLLLIRLDDIGDYLLFRNQLRVYKNSSRWMDHKITLLGNESWQDLFTLLDKDAVDDTMWVNKNRYFESADYRMEIWKRLRENSFETVIAPSRTRPLLVDDLCMLAAAPLNSLGSENTTVHASWSRVSDGLYTSLFKPSHALMHEFHFNAEFAEWACGIRYSGNRPRIEHRFPRPVAGPYIICFVGASARSKRWPIKRWIEFIALHRREYFSKIFLAGNSKAERERVRIIQRRTGVDSIAGRVALSELLHWVAGADAVVTNDTMAAHMGASLGTPTVIIANGLNYMRFSEYLNAGIDRVATIYPEVFNRRRKRLGDGPYAHSETVTADIASIGATTVIESLRGLFAGQPANPINEGAATDVVAPVDSEPQTHVDSSRAACARHRH